MELATEPGPRRLVGQWNRVEDETDCSGDVTSAVLGCSVCTWRLTPCGILSREPLRRVEVASRILAKTSWLGDGGLSPVMAALPTTTRLNRSRIIMGLAVAARCNAIPAARFSCSDEDMRLCPGRTSFFSAGEAAAAESMPRLRLAGTSPIDGSLPRLKVELAARAEVGVLNLLLLEGRRKAVAAS